MSRKHVVAVSVSVVVAAALLAVGNLFRADPPEAGSGGHAKAPVREPPVEPVVVAAPGHDNQVRQVASLPPLAQGAPSVADGVARNGRDQSDGQTVTPVTPREREMFIDMVLLPHFRKVAAHDLASESRETHRSRLEVGLTPDRSSAAEAALEAVVSAEVAFAAAKNSALVDYVRQAKSLAEIEDANPLPKDGVGGVVSYGMEPEWRRFWGSASGIRVSYWLKFDQYPDLARANASLQAARRNLSPFVARR